MGLATWMQFVSSKFFARCLFASSAPVAIPARTATLLSFTHSFEPGRRPAESGGIQFSLEGDKGGCPHQVARRRMGKRRRKKRLGCSARFPVLRGTRIRCGTLRKPISSVVSMWCDCFSPSSAGFMLRTTTLQCGPEEQLAALLPNDPPPPTFSPSFRALPV